MRRRPSWVRTSRWHLRITDTRPNSGQPNAGKTLAAAATLNVQVTGLGTVPAGASAAVLNVTAVDPTVAGFLTVFPGDRDADVSNLNLTPGVIVANLVTVPLSTAGMVSIFNHAGNTNVVVDVDGYYTSTPSTNGTGLYNSMSPVRALGNLQLGAPVAANTSVPVTVTGAITGVPASATAVVVNVTAAHGTSASYLTVYPAGAATVPTASSVNFIAGQAIANRVTVGVGTNGQIEVYNHTGTVNVDVDVDGYYSGVGGTGSAFVPITPVRITDTRGTTPLNGTPIAANTSESFNLATTLSTVPGTATSVAANVTAVAGNAAATSPSTRRPLRRTLSPLTSTGLRRDRPEFHDRRHGRYRQRRGLQRRWCGGQPPDRRLRVLRHYEQRADHGIGCGEQLVHRDHLQRGRVVCNSC